MRFGAFRKIHNENQTMQGLRFCLLFQLLRRYRRPDIERTERIIGVPPRRL